MSSFSVHRALAKDLIISGTPGFIVGTELVPGALNVNGLKALIARAGTESHKRDPSKTISREISPISGRKTNQERSRTCKIHGFQ
jgi:hypothetical protein